MVKHPLFAIIFQLEYVVNVPVSQPELPTNKKTRTKVVFSVDWRNICLKQVIKTLEILLALFNF